MALANVSGWNARQVSKKRFSYGQFHTIGSSIRVILNTRVRVFLNMLILNSFGEMINNI